MATKKKAVPAKAKSRESTQVDELDQDVDLENDETQSGGSIAVRAHGVPERWRCRIKFIASEVTIVDLDSLKPGELEELQADRYLEITPV